MKDRESLFPSLSSTWEHNEMTVSKPGRGKHQEVDHAGTMNADFQCLESSEITVCFWSHSLWYPVIATQTNKTVSIVYGILLQQLKLKEGIQEERDKEKRNKLWSRKTSERKWEWSLKSYKIITKKGQEHSRQETNVNTDKIIAIFPGTQLRLSNFFKTTW